MGKVPASILVALALAASLPGQPAQRGRRPQTAAAALDTYRKELSDPEERRTRGVRNLGSFEGEEVTDALVSTWRGAKTIALRLAALQVLADRRRDGTLGLLTEIVETGEDVRIREAAATGLGRHGDAGVAVLEKQLLALDAKRHDAAAKPSRSALFGGLATAGTERAYDLLAKVASDSADPARDDALRRLANAPETAAVREAREGALRAANPVLAAEALRQLAAKGWPGTKDAALALCKRLPAKVAATVPAVLVDILGKHLGPDTFESFLQQAAAVEGDLEQRHADAVAAARGSAEFVAWLATEGLANKQVSARVAAVHILAKAEQDVVTKALVALVRGDDDEVAAAAMRAAVVRADRAGFVPVLREVLRAGSEARRADALLALHALQRGDAAWRTELGTLLTAASAGVRTVACDLLAELGANEALPQAQRLLEDKAWTVRAAAYAFCRVVRDPSSIGPLIDRLDKEQGRLREDALDALEAITTLRFSEAARWQRWWADSEKGYVMPPAKPKPDAKPAGKAAAATTVSAYYDIPLVSQSVAFVLDTSGSMAARVGTGKSTRLDESKRQLTKALAAMPETTRFNVIFFDTGVHEQAKHVAPADKRHRDDALAGIEKLVARGGTNIFDALERAFADPAVDTIYLLTDGAPSAGRILDSDAIAAEVARWNHARKIKIHAISVGEDSKLLRKLAEQSGGEYRYVR